MILLHIPFLDTRKVGELVIHLSSGPFEGDMVHGELDWARRGN